MEGRGDELIRRCADPEILVTRETVEMPRRQPIKARSHCDISVWRKDESSDTAMEGKFSPIPQLLGRQA
ncbi:hypothetical protein PAHAL_2G202100 [Panicum hallii]|jgi:hypothetical protein|uniref:Uncharacterized protein n=1 Tax=Panicum hallii TaxID=206008 RepID=A0A2S3GY42_9POAL|nr:hypothetical protein PAHAL_2G202100 [Panicum hallii]